VHEFSITSQIVQNVLAEAEQRGAKKVTEVNLTIGKLTFLGLDQVRFAYQVLTKGTIAEGSKLVIEEQEGFVKCSNCGYQGGFKYEDDPLYHVPVPTLKCPKCSSTVNIAAGKECTIRNIKMLVK
jgi:hydrogenase nickel incorporation protein HypA/HybF